jgi:hypothetical protein
MTIELKPRKERIAAEIDEVLKQAKEKSAECDSIVVLMQRENGGVVYVANDSMRLETLSFVASSFLYDLHRGIRGNA